MKKWKCTVCGYVHVGEEPPEKCPVCGADKSKFVLLAEEKPAAPSVTPSALPTEKTEPAPSPTGAPALGRRLIAWLLRQMVKNHAHPISVHIPNGVLPAAVLFLLLATGLELAGVLSADSSLAAAAFFNLLFVVVAMPFVLFSGWVDWKARFGGELTRTFLTKMICGAGVFIVGLVLVVLRLAAGESVELNSGLRGAYLLLHLLMLALAAYAGYLGGRLVFKE